MALTEKQGDTLIHISEAILDRIDEVCPLPSNIVLRIRLNFNDAVYAAQTGNNPDHFLGHLNKVVKEVVGSQAQPSVKQCVKAIGQAALEVKGNTQLPDTDIDRMTIARTADAFIGMKPL